MSGDRYKISDQHARYFLTLTIIHWIDVFTRSDYKDIVVNSLNYCVEAKGLDIYAWVIMSNHVHLVAGCRPPNKMSDFLRDFKKYTSKRILEAIQEINESRRDWLLDKFSFEARRTGRAADFKLWMDGNHAVDMDNNDIDIMEKINYIHENPVRARIVDNPEDYVYSSAIDYFGKRRGLVKVIVN
jgi:putative transposase